MTLSILLQQGSPGGFLGGSGSGLLMIVLLFVIMWFFMIRPQQKRQKEIEKQRAALKTGDKIVTSGGVHGKLKEINDRDYVIEIAEGVKVKIDKASVFAAPNETSSGK
ncbi:MAG: preprotein translocase subunit YajC [Dysgonamonadaceae bacterium]|jgi:preprotein translocase subunit YajC|nr:preprotein translocase subunit YajC [Dysgonamonadaceae bacterium]